MNKEQHLHYLWNVIAFRRAVTQHVDEMAEEALRSCQLDKIKVRFINQSSQ